MPADTLDPTPLIAQVQELLSMQLAEEGEQLARRGLMRFPGSDLLRCGLGYALLAQGRYPEGFRELEIRHHRLKSPLRELSYPEWDGPLAGRSILIWGEQGLGDEIMMARYVRDLRAMGAKRITWACSSPLIRALEKAGADLVVSRHGAVTVPKHDCWVMAFSLPYRLGVTLDAVRGAPYLQAEPRGRGGIGLVERGRAENPVDIHRSIPHGLLQAAVPNGRILEPDGDVYDALCRLAGLDLLITVDTAWAHMAGALGVPCWVLLPYRTLDWRWLRERRDTPWYDSITLFRQPADGDWTSVLKEVKAALAKWPQNRAGRHIAGDTE